MRIESKKKQVFLYVGAFFVTTASLSLGALIIMFLIISS
ncbi:hypothetical protein BC624_1126 [Flavobacterium granuli]|uniref:Uncharacterized protein n=1 Tax=Flavobacterium granuli TaxID=280093 RepID=A0A1M5TCS3_9FLAO|nr:hypothetical protein BC624_1126 [Flavobacterium granuli]SHH48486.1 hypothetical protein SAMN05443373_1146 [Flavobacterium granuli]